MSKAKVVVSCPIDTYSGYGARSRDFVQALIDTNEYDVKILPQRWGETRWGYLKDHNDTELSSRIIRNMADQPEVWIQITIPNEFKAVGKYNIGVTAGIETTLCDPSWIKGANNMNLMLVSSKHALESFQRSKFDLTDPKTKQHVENIEIKTKMEVLFEGADLTKYIVSKEKTDVTETLDKIPESFCYLTTGHWMQGAFGEDRKNMGFTLKAFLETFKNKKNPPALVMKSHSVTTSTLDRNRILEQIEAVRKTVKGKLPNVYLLHGEVSDKEMNSLYNHPKIKAFLSLPKGEGFGRPFLEFSLVNKPIIASYWSGQTDFLSSEFIRPVKGVLKPVHKSVLVKEIIIEQAEWFTPDAADTGKALKDVHTNYKKWATLAKRQGHKSRTEFSYEKMVDTLKTILDTNVPKFAQEVNLALPPLDLPKLTLPKLKKI